ncbi:plastocyanin/azurin family copper-binding protein [Salinirubellus salinus]|uniref:Plastocyanin/azurin family copper-binding protein n=1 Tax=Salinirubellus salinus TaxID=1364945 RepID=A0A9E7R1D4_9EURY|nr:plastocyanin/azurin family copper-binding protein [Salinirubellus salinus]UWM53931.1 plastocyanin/azurin family copper-binding protein [Salinirubellus salinus]
MTRRRTEEGWTAVSRRSALATAVGVVGSLAGCLGQPSVPDADVVAGPDRRLRFEPADLTASVGDTVRWGFESAGHNVCGRPSDASTASVPEDGAPFASYAPDESPARQLVPRGETYEHTFETPGEFVYVCYPHRQSGMEGTVRVTE